MKNFKYVVDEIYEFFDEILGSIVPGIYFCSYAIFIIFIFLFVCSTNYSYDIPYIALFIFSVSYVLGTMFRRSNSREPDYRSAKYIYLNSRPHDDNDYAFVKVLSNDEYKKIVDNFIDFINDNDINIKYNYNIVKKRTRKLSLSERLFSPKHEIKSRKNKEVLCSKPFVINYIYELLEKHRKKLKKKVPQKAKIIDDFIEANNLKYFCVLYVDYPYSNLKNYLLDRGMYSLSKYITWEEDDDSQTTKRSKSVICNMKIDIKHYLPNDYSQLMKTEAHIRFMNAMWYGNKLLTWLVETVLIISGLLFVILFFVLDYELLNKLYNSNAGEKITNRIKSTVDIIKNIFETIFGNDFDTEKLMVAFLLVVILSLAYLMFNSIIKKTIENNFHYQRIREIVSILHLYDLVKKLKCAKIHINIKHHENIKN